MPTRCATCASAYGPGSKRRTIRGRSWTGMKSSALGERRREAMSTRRCPDCGKTYGADYADTFCVCGVELVVSKSAAPAVTAPAARPQAEATELHAKRPPPGTPCLVLYGP